MTLFLFIRHRIATLDVDNTVRTLLQLFTYRIGVFPLYSGKSRAVSGGTPRVSCCMLCVLSLILSPFLDRAAPRLGAHQKPPAELCVAISSGRVSRNFERGTGNVVLGTTYYGTSCP